MIYSLLTQHYLLTCSALALVFSIWSHRNTWLWAGLAVTLYLLWVNKSYFGIYNMTMYYNRAFIVFIAGIAFTRFKTKSGYYLAFIQMMFLILYGLLEYDTENGTNMVYDNFEGLVYGLVTSQFIVIFPELWIRYGNRATGHINTSKRYKGAK